MTNDRIQRWLRDRLLSAASPKPIESEAAAIIIWMLSSAGPVAIADQAAWELIKSECIKEDHDGQTYWSTHPTALKPPSEQWHSETAEELAAALRYLSVRGLLAHHPINHYLVRWP